MSDWCILRTSGRHTLVLAQTLADDGFEVWTPVETRERLAGRNRESVEQDIAILPEYVFAGMRHLTDLLHLSRSSGLNYRVWSSEQRRMVFKAYPQFSVFHLHGRIYPQGEGALAPLRALEASLQAVAERRRQEAKQKGPAPTFKTGEAVRVEGGGFDGLNLTVSEGNEDTLGKTVKLIHPSWLWAVEISAWKLHEVQVPRASPAIAA